ncbi:hypothetical protein MHYP_G00116270 [Metynnis hypsauchen]
MQEHTVTTLGTADGRVIQVSKVPLIGPGCEQLWSCSLCLLAPSFMGCGWCRNRNLCSRSAQRETSLWSQDSCPIFITEETALLNHKPYCHGYWADNSIKLIASSADETLTFIDFVCFKPCGVIQI